MTIYLLLSEIPINIIRYGNDSVSMALAKHDVQPEVCDVAGCSNPAERSFNIKQVSKSSLKLKDEGARQIHLCKEHYREFKKETKTDRSLDQVY
jgi:hypothetical protein